MLSQQDMLEAERHGRQVRSQSRLTNRGATPLVLEWFAHPFFALEADGRQHITLPADTTLPGNRSALEQPFSRRNAR